MNSQTHSVHLVGDGEETNPFLSWFVYRNYFLVFLSTQQQKISSSSLQHSGGLIGFV